MGAEIVPGTKPAGVSEGELEEVGSGKHTAV